MSYLNSLFVVFVNFVALQLLDRHFESKSTASAPGPLLDVVYNKHAGELVACGPGFFGVSFYERMLFEFFKF